jgi:serine/threonine protein kinase
MAATPISSVVCPRCGANFDPKLDLRFCGTCGADLGSISSPVISLPTDEVDGDRETLRAKDPLLGEVLDSRYKIIESIGQGGMGKVYLVEHQQMSKRMAMKLLHRELASNRDIARRFRREALAISRLTSPHTVQVFDFGQGPFGMYLVMELLRGEDLGKIIYREEKLTLQRTIDLLFQAATALEEAHGQGIVHRDLKPENLFITKAHNGNEHLKILDFGLAKLQSAANEETGHGRLLGTPYYMSPEQIRGGDVDARADIYAIGALFCKMLTGEPPYKADSPLGVLSRHISDPIPKLKERLPDVHPAAQRFFEHLLAKDPNKRPKDIKEVQRLLQTLAEESKEEAPAESKEESGVLPLVVDAGSATRADWNDFSFRQQRRRRAGTLLPFLFLGIGGAAAYHYREEFFPSQPKNSEREPNNDYRTATEIPLDTPISGFLGKRLDEKTPDRDLYKINLKTKGPHLLQVDCSGIPNVNLRLDTAIIKDGAATLLEPSGDSSGRGGAESLSIKVEADTVYVVVRQISYGDSVVENVSDAYTLTVKVSPAPASEPVAADPFTTPKPLTSGLPVEGYINGRFALDVYRLTTPGKRLSARLDPIAGIDASLELYSAEKKLLFTSDRTKENQEETIDSFVIPEGEPPFLVVRKKGGQSEGVSYQLIVTIK